MKLTLHNATLRKRCARVSLILGGRENKPYFALYGSRNRSRNRVGGGKTREIFLYQKIILFA
ncbi:hypothetical protein, partial [Leptospira weilii]|uniref:hypothetical protein n=1 Tax=Leptospira weilii TaxID=28184 RepID=UPI001F2563C9